MHLVLNGDGREGAGPVGVEGTQRHREGEGQCGRWCRKAVCEVMVRLREPTLLPLPSPLGGRLPFLIYKKGGGGKMKAH